MIDDTTIVFPNNVVSLVATRVELLDPDLVVFRRPLREADPHQSVGIVAANWLPNEDSYEMLGAPQGRHEPSLQNYFITIQAFVRHGDEEKGLAIHSVLSKMLRAMLYRDNALRVGLASLSASMSGSTETTKRWGVRQQRYFSNELQGSWLYLSNLEFWLETETI
jgi:hypothetical protein